MMRDLYIRKLEDIFNRIYLGYGSSVEPSLGFGGGGVLLFLLYYGKLCPSDLLMEFTYTVAESTFKKCEDARNSVKGAYFTGAAGTVAAFENITANRLLDTDVHEVFRDVDQAVYQRITNFDLQKPRPGAKDELIEYGIYMQCRQNSRLAPRGTINYLQKVAALISVVDYIGLLVDGTANINSKNINRICAYLIFLHRVSRQKVYPEICAGIMQRILGLVERFLADSRNLKRGIPTCLVYGIAAVQPRHTSPALTGIIDANLINPNPAGGLLNNIVDIQQLNRLYWSTQEADFRSNAALQIAALEDRVKGNLSRKEMGLAGLSGLGLCMLSYLDRECLAWDSVLCV
ncbi:hypothetical protein EGT74_13885 [Chitinophaga lutea]|uniref:Lanthionine synthetase C family protein n=2 Tax=Chitinophaga lutea TaxID=2488634 RepID=A0A3N4Q8V8_9BACT|nr:hypothetical protein EGT74_13885 [Chitinophaga lutea]